MAFGDIGVMGKTYTRQELGALGIHRNPRGGIQGSGQSGKGAESVLVTGGYEDDVDLGQTILYTGHGGQGPRVGSGPAPQVKDQELTHLNKTLAENVTSGMPVRVIRDSGGLYRYDGLFQVVGVRDLLGKSGHRIWQYELHALTAGAPAAKATPPKGKAGPPRRAPVAPSDRIVRDTAMSRWVKGAYDYTCQVCGIRLQTRSGLYAEGAHIDALALGGPDEAENILCLCPNHHTLLDYGGLYLTDLLEVVSASGVVLGQLTVRPHHAIDVQHVRNHRSRFGF